MRVGEKQLNMDMTHIVIVDAKKFYEAWMGETVDQCKIYKKYCEQEKYDEAIDGFSRGIDNPVPIAEIKYPCKINVIGGKTRNKWLIINGATCFPILCPKEAVIKVHIQYMYGDYKIEDADELFK
jgi:hypothetical protein